VNHYKAVRIAESSTNDHLTSIWKGKKKTKANEHLQNHESWSRLTCSLCCSSQVRAHSHKLQISWKATEEKTNLPEARENSWEIVLLSCGQNHGQGKVKSWSPPNSLEIRWTTANE
jgi:hypothetical protein